jgi:hypothetical protein
MAGREVGLPLQDRRLIDLAANGASPEEIENSLGIPAAEAVVRVREILRSRDVWDEVERRQLLLHSAHKLKAKIEEGLDLDSPEAVRTYLATLKMVGEMLDKSGRLTEEELERVTQAQAQKMIQLIEAGYGHARRLLAEEFPHVDIDKVDAAFHEGLREAVLVES